MALGIYIHIPFCAAICNYCNFNRGLLDEAVKRRYVDALVRDIHRQAEPAEPADTIYVGGGTPSLLTPDEVARIVGACRDSFAITHDAEVTMEANPESVSAASLGGYRAAGVNRLSFGTQSFRDEELARLGRLHSADTARRAVALAREAGFDNVSQDLMMWLPGQSVAQWLESVRALIDVGPDHASLYLLEVYPNAPLKDELARAGWSLAPDDDAADMYLEAMSVLDAAGYQQYEISNVARPPARRSRHNLKYWQEGAWLGFGCGAHATRGAERWRVVPAVGDFIARVDAGVDTAIERRTRDLDEQLEEALFMGLRLVEGLDLAAMAARHGVDVWQRYGVALAPFIETGAVVHDPGRRLRLTRKGMLLANSVMAVFIGGPVR